MLTLSFVALEYKSIFHQIDNSRWNEISHSCISNLSFFVDTRVPKHIEKFKAQSQIRGKERYENSMQNE